MSKEGSGFDSIQTKYELLQSNLDNLSTRIEVLLQASAGYELGKDFEALQNEIKGLQTTTSEAHKFTTDGVKQYGVTKELLDFYNASLSKSFSHSQSKAGILASTEKALFNTLEISEDRRTQEAWRESLWSKPEEIKVKQERLEDIKNRYKLMEGLFKESNDTNALTKVKENIETVDLFINKTKETFREASNHKKYIELEKEGRETYRENEFPFPPSHLDKVKPESKAKVTPEYIAFVNGEESALRRLKNLSNARNPSLFLAGADNYKGMHKLASEMQVDFTSVPLPPMRFEESQHFTNRKLNQKLISEIPPGVYKDIQDCEDKLCKVSEESYNLASNALKEFTADLSNKKPQNIKEFIDRRQEIEEQQRQFWKIQQIPGNKSVEARIGSQQTLFMANQAIDEQKDFELKSASTKQEKDAIQLKMARQESDLYSSALGVQMGLDHGGMSYDALMMYKEKKSFENPLTQYLDNNIDKIEALKSEVLDYNKAHRDDLKNPNVGIDDLNDRSNQHRGFLHRVYRHQDDLNAAVASTFSNVSQRIDDLKDNQQNIDKMSQVELDQNLKKYHALRTELSYVKNFSGPHISDASNMLREMDRQVGDLLVAREKGLTQGEAQEKAEQEKQMEDRKSQLEQDTLNATSRGKKQTQKRNQSEQLLKTDEEQILQSQMQQHYTNQEQQLGKQIDQTKPIYFGQHRDREIEAIISNVGKPMPGSNNVLTNAIATGMVANRIGSMPMCPTNPHDPNYQQELALFKQAVKEGKPVREEAPDKFYTEHNGLDPRVFEVNFNEMANPSDGSKPFSNNLYLPRMKDGQPIRDKESGAIIQDVIEFNEQGNPVGLFLGEPHTDSAIHPNTINFLKSKGIFPKQDLDINPDKAHQHQAEQGNNLSQLTGSEIKDDSHLERDSQGRSAGGAGSDIYEEMTGGNSPNIPNTEDRPVQPIKESEAAIAPSLKDQVAGIRQKLQQNDTDRSVPSPRPGPVPPKIGPTKIPPRN